jgi:RNA polymerase sigma factor (sigma-70 family)
VKRVPYNDMTDAELLQRFHQEKQSEWIGLLLQRYTLLLFGVCLKYLKDEDEAKDAVQQVFLKVLTDVERFKIDYFKSWLYTVAKNHCLMQLREKQGKKTGGLPDAMALQHEDLKLFDRMEHETTYLFLEQALQELTPEQQDCIRLFYLHKQSYQQISEKTGYSLLQVKSYIQNGKRNLKAALEKKAVRPQTK